MITHNSTWVIYSWLVMTVCWVSRWVTHLACGFIFLLVSFRISLHILLFQHIFNHSQKKILVICFDVAIQYMGNIFFCVPLSMVAVMETLLLTKPASSRRTVPWLRWLMIGLSVQRPGFCPGSFQMGFWLVKVAVGLVLSEYFVFPCQCEAYSSNASYSFPFVTDTV